MSDFDKVLELVGEAAGLRYHLRSAIEWASDGQVPPPEIINLWRSMAGEHWTSGRKAGGVGGVGDGEGLHNSGEVPR